MTTRLAIAAVLALMAGWVFARGTFREFERVRIPLSAPRISGPGTEISFDVPDLAGLDDDPLVLLIDVESDDDAPRTIAIAFDETLIGRFDVRGRRERVAAIVADRLQEGDGHTLRIRSDSRGWTVARAQLSNVRGFSNGLINTVVVPSTAGFERPPVAYALVVLTAAAMAVYRIRVWRSGLGRPVEIATTALAVVVLVAVIAAPFVSPYRIVMAFHTWLTVIALMCLPAIARIGADLPKVPIPPISKWFVIILAVLAATSVPRRVGDGAEYLAMTAAFRDGRWPEVDVGHFWLYSAVATPLVAITDAVMFGEPAGFALTNGLLLACACVVASRRHAAPVVAMVFVGPIIWWLDKVHAEVFLFSLLVLAVVWLDEKPTRSLLALGAAAAQNPAVAPLLPIAALTGVVRQRSLARDASFWMCAAVAAVLALLNPLYYFLRTGRAFLLLPDNKPAWPTTTELMTFLIDPNIGLFANVPPLALAAVLAAWSARRSLLRATQMFALAAAAVLLFGFTQATNVNHGGTPGMSRYALWLIPLMIPLLQEAAVHEKRRGKQTMLFVAVLSAAWCVALFHPARSERFFHPTRLAEMLWTRYPGASNPVPEIFIERLQHHERSWTIPIATEGCEKALIGSPDGSEPAWPPQCRPHPVPEVCRRSGAMCYANRSGRGVGFAPVTYWPYPPSRD
jgi:hypothetical protein